MPVNLKAPLPLVPDADGRAMLDMLQGNILASHGRKATAHLFVAFDPAEAAAARAFVKAIGKLVTSAAAQAAEAAAFKAGKKTNAFVACVLSSGGYAALGIAKGQTPAAEPFREGMKARGAKLSDPDPGTWEKAYRGEVHLMVLVGGDPDPGKSGSSKQVDAVVRAVEDLVTPGVKMLAVERGRAYFNASGDGVEHFGYVDGRSQPLLRQKDVDAEAAKKDGIVRWNPAFALDQVLVRDPATKNALAFGSFFVFRKLEQNVKGFLKAERDLAKQLRKLDPTFDPKLAGAMVVGRFRDGTPVVLQRDEGMHHPVPNDFDYAGDPAGLKCPFHAHIRKTNPRGDTVRMFDRPLAEERGRIMARRGITYGTRAQGKDATFADAPAKGSGLLFMAYQADLARQFEFTQASWANSEGFVADHTGVDPIIGQGGALGQTHRAGWGDTGAKTMKFRFADFVTLKGGEYFFAPSLPFFAAL